MRLLSLIILLMLFSIGCQDKPDVQAEIASLEAQLTSNPSQETLEKLVSLYTQAAEAASGADRITYLWKTGETARAVQDFQTAEKCFVEIYEQHSDSPEASKALFLHAFMADEDQEAFDKAKTLYETFIEKYPDSDFADDARFLLEHLGKSDEEMLQILSQKNAEGVQEQ